MHQFDYVDDEDNALVWAGSEHYGVRLVTFKYNYFHYVDPLEGYLQGREKIHYHFWYNHDNRFFIPKDENVIDFQVRSGETDHGYYLREFNDAFITLSSPVEGQCILSFPLTMYYNENEMMKAKSISVYFDMSDEQKQKIKGELMTKIHLKL